MTVNHPVPGSSPGLGAIFMSEEEEFKKELGIHKFDHFDMLREECIELLKQEYSGIHIRIDKNIQSLLHSYVINGIDIYISYRNITLKETVDQVDNSVLIKMLKQLDEMCS